MSDIKLSGLELETVLRCVDKVFETRAAVEERDRVIAALDAELARIQDAYLAAVQNMHDSERKVTSANTRLDCALARGNRLRNVMSMLRSPDEETRLLMHAAADEWDKFSSITTDSRNASKAWHASNESQGIEKVEGGAR